MKPGRNDPCPCGSGKKFKKCCAAKPEDHPTAQDIAAKTTAPTPAECSQLAALFNAGRYAELENLAHLLVDQYPDSGLAWKVLGASLSAQNKEALPALQRATELLPDDAEAHSNLGNALRGIGQLDDAVESYRRALEIKPDFAGALSNLGNVLQDLGQLDDAVASYRRALEVQPDFAKAHSNLGNALQGLGRLDDAVASYRRALKIQPGFAEAHNNLGNILRDLGQLDDAVASCRRALEIKPDFAEAHGNLGNALQDLGQLGDAVASYRRALEIKPDYAKVLCNLGKALQEQGQLDDAVASYRRALEIQPDFAEAHSNLGNTLQSLGQIDAAEASYRRALEIQPDFAEVHSNLLFTRNYLANLPPGMLLADARHFGDIVARQARPYSGWRDLAEPGRKLRVGLVSGDLRAHPVGYFIEGVLTALTSNPSVQLGFFGYPSYSVTDALTERIKACCSGWHSAAGLSDETLARRIRDDGIDILIDLSGHTAHNRLPMFAWKPAPVQASWLGYLGTTGVAAIDYLIADPWVLPESDEVNFTEKIWRLPETYLCFTPPEEDVSVSSLPALANGYITFGSFNNLTKINDAVVALWARVLASVPDSRLFLKTKQLGAASVRQDIAERFAVHGIDSQRLVLEGSVAQRSEHLAAYHKVDIALDPFPYPGITTSVESLWMGVPMLTLAGEHFLSRQGIGLLMNAGLPEWIADNADDYVARAASHACGLQRLASLRNGLRQQVLASPLFDAARFAVHFEEALRGMWHRRQERQTGLS